MAPPASAAIIEAPANPAPPALPAAPSSPEAHRPAKRRSGAVVVGRRAPLTPGDEREAAAESLKKNHAADLSARVAHDDDSDYEGSNCPPRPPIVTRKHK